MDGSGGSGKRRRGGGEAGAAAACNAVGTEASGAAELAPPSPWAAESEGDAHVAGGAAAEAEAAMLAALVRLLLVGAAIQARA